MRMCPLWRAVAIALVTLTPAAAAESVLGVVRDGAVHHESAAAAAAHRDAGPQSGHGHDDSVPSHQHGTPADHCTHVHGLAVIISAAPLSFGAPVSAQHQADPFIFASRSSLDAFHPPRA